MRGNHHRVGRFADNTAQIEHTLSFTDGALRLVKETGVGTRYRGQGVGAYFPVWHWPSTRRTGPRYGFPEDAGADAVPFLIEVTRLPESRLRDWLAGLYWNPVPSWLQRWLPRPTYVEETRQLARARVRGEPGAVRQFLEIIVLPAGLAATVAFIRTMWWEHGVGLKPVARGNAPVDDLLPVWVSLLLTNHNTGGLAPLAPVPDQAAGETVSQQVGGLRLAAMWAKSSVNWRSCPISSPSKGSATCRPKG